LEEKRGSYKKGEWLRMASLDKFPLVLPEINNKVLRTGLRPIYRYENIHLYFATGFLAAPLSAQSAHSLK